MSGGNTTLTNDLSTAVGAVAIDTTAADQTIKPCRGIVLAVAGALKVTMKNGDVITFNALAAGIVHPISAKLIWKVGTTATTGIVALY